MNVHTSKSDTIITFVDKNKYITHDVAYDSLACDVIYQHLMAYEKMIEDELQYRWKNNDQYTGFHQLPTNLLEHVYQQIHKLNDNFPL